MSLSSIQAAKILVQISSYGLTKTQLFAMIFISDYVFNKRYGHHLINDTLIPHAYLPYNQKLNDKIFGYGTNNVKNVFRSIDIDNVSKLESQILFECYSIYKDEPDYILYSIINRIDQNIKNEEQILI